MDAMTYRFVLFVSLVCFAGIHSSPAIAQQSRAVDGLQVLYDFGGDGAVIRDRSGKSPSLDLKIESTSAVERGDGWLRIKKKAAIRSSSAASRLATVIQKSGKVTIEAWLKPANNTQAGPARIVTLSADSQNRNFTLGQDRSKFDVRFRTEKTDNNGIPSLSDGGVDPTAAMHVAYVREQPGKTRLYLNGKEVASRTTTGTLKNWRKDFRLALGDELNGGRTWLGTYFLVAIYDRALTKSEVGKNFAAKPAAISKTLVAKATPKSQPAKPSETQVPPSSGGPRVVRDLQVLYDFTESSGNQILDRSGVGKPLNLKIEDPKSVKHNQSSLELVGNGTGIRSDGPATKLNRSIKQSGAVTIEVWLRPSNISQNGPARIVTLSKDSSNRNMTLGQERNQYQVRFRTTGTSTNGIPSTDAKSAKTELTHVVYTRDRSGAASIFVNAKSVARRNVKGSTNNWDSSYRFALADELSGGRRWLGTFHLIAVYSRDLSAAEIAQNFAAGPSGSSVEAVAALKAEKQKHLFVTKVAPLLANRCLECHDSATHQGGLDLSRKESAFAGGESGPSLVAGNLDDSLLWTSVEDDSMPHDREALTANEKKLLKDWIADGATWTLEMIDPAVYVHSGDSSELWVQRLTISEYIETVRWTLGVDIAAEAQQLLPPEKRADGFSNTAYNLNVDLKHIDAYSRLARMIVKRMNVGQFASRFGKGRRLTDDNMRDLIAKMGKRVLRGPLDEDEVVLYRGISTTVASAGGSFEDAVGYVLEAMLQSPRFIYRIESQTGDGSEWSVNSYELASRLSYILWGGPPDEELFKVAESGKLAERNEVLRQATRMLKDPRAVGRSREFIRQWMNLDGLANLRPDSKRFPTWNARLARDMRAETLAFFEEVVWRQKRPLSDLLTAQVTFATPALASHYGLKAKGERDEMQKYDLTKVPARGGLLTQGSALTIGGDDASMVTRGLLVMHELLRGVVNDPPPCVDTTPVATKAGLTQRMIAQSRIDNQACGGCHGRFEPLAFGLEKFDGVGAFHDRDEHGNVLREDGEVLIPGEAKSQSYQTSEQLMKILAKSARVKASLTWKVTQYSLGRPLVAEDAPIVQQIHQTAEENGGTYAAVMTAIVTSDLVTKIRTEAN